MYASPETPPMSRQFAVLWTNDSTHTRPMTRHGVTLRGTGLVGLDGLTFSSLHLDQVQIVFRPNTDIDAGEYATGDNSTYTWRVETSQLYVQTRPGKNHVLIVTNDTDPKTNEGTVTGQSNLHHHLVYSAALSLAPNVDGNEDYWVRTYRPIRDLPIAEYGCGISELDIQLLFPLLMGDDRALPFYTIPNYRILKVICQFSVRS